MKIVNENAARGNGQSPSAMISRHVSVFTTISSRGNYRFSLRPYWLSSHANTLNEQGVLCIEELDRLSNNFDEDVLVAPDDSLMCSLSQHQKMSKQIALDSRSLEQFSFILSHKLRAPIANALGLAELLESKMISEEERKSCQQFLCASVRQIDIEIRAMNDVMTQYLFNAGNDYTFRKRNDRQ